MAFSRSLFVATAAAASLAAARAQLSVSFDATTPQHNVADFFLSYNIDTGSIYNGFDFTNTKLINMVRQLAPAVVRIGGTAADYSFMVPQAASPNGGNGHTLISWATWDNILAFVQATGVQLLWDFDSLQFRDKHNNWDPTGNATAVLAYTQSKYAGMDIWWSTGNEPDLWPGQKVSGQLLAGDATILKNTLQNYNVGKTVYGPSYAGFNSQSGTFIQDAMPAAIDGFTCHNYPLARHCTLTDYLNPSYIEAMRKPMEGIAAAKAAANSSILLVLEETGGSYGGGCDNITNRFASGFWYLHTMGVVAEAGFDRMHRQDIAGWSFTGGMSHYELIGPPGWVSGNADLTPHPDYFSSILQKQNTGKAILKMQVTGNGGNASVHLWCANSRTTPAGTGVTLVFLNPNSGDLTITLNGAPGSTRTDYILTANAQSYEEFAARRAAGVTLEPLAGDAVVDPPSYLSNDEVYLNGVLMTVDAQGVLPAYPIAGATGNPTAPVVVPPYSYGFVVYTGGAGAVPACAAA